MQTTVNKSAFQAVIEPDQVFDEISAGNLHHRLNVNELTLFPAAHDPLCFRQVLAKSDQVLRKHLQIFEVFRGVLFLRKYVKNSQPFLFFVRTGV